MADLIGKVIQGYRILEPIETEPIGNSYKAIASDNKQVVIIRFLPAEVGRNPRLQERLQIAIQKLSMLKEPAILPALASGIFEGYPYLIFPYKCAGSLMDRINAGILSAMNIGEVVGDIAAALSAAHSRELFHGNLSPGDILFDEEGMIHLGGLAEASVLSLLRSHPRQAANGSMGYQAPEVLKGQSIAPSADQYALGLIALQLLTGLPLDEATYVLESLQQADRSGITQPSRGSRSLSSKMVAVLRRALSSNPEDRFPSIEEMNSAFQCALGIEPPKCEVKTVEAKMAKVRQRTAKRWVSPLLMLAMLCLLVSAIAVFASGGVDIARLLALLDNRSHSEKREELPLEQDQRVMIQSPDHALLQPTMSPDPIPILPSDDALTLTEEIPASGMTKNAPGGATSSSDLSEPAQTSKAEETSVADAIASTEPSLTPTSTSTSAIELTPTPTSTPTPASKATIPPPACKEDPGHRNYCTPTPTP